MTTRQLLATSCCLATLIFGGQSLGADAELTGCLLNGRLVQLQRADEPISSRCRGNSEQVTIPSPADDDIANKFRIYTVVANGDVGFFPIGEHLRLVLACRTPTVDTEIQTTSNTSVRLTSTVQSRVAAIRSDLPVNPFVAITIDPGDADWYLREISFDAVSRTEDGLFIALDVTRGYVAYGPEYDDGCLLFVEGEIIELPPPP